MILGNVLQKALENSKDTCQKFWKNCEMTSERLKHNK